MEDNIDESETRSTVEGNDEPVVVKTRSTVEDNSNRD